MPRVGGCQPHRRVKAGCGRPPEDVSAEVTLPSDCGRRILGLPGTWPPLGHRPRPRGHGTESGEVRPSTATGATR